MSELRNIFGSKQVFLDMEDIEAGSDFPQIIDEAVSNCELLLVIIGPNWLELRDEQGQRRIEAANDFVRLEVSAALVRKIPIIPVLVENTKMPKAEELPDEIKLLSTLQVNLLTHDRWDDDIPRLINAIEKVTVEPQISRLYSKALTNIDQGNWQEGLANLEAIISVQPRYSDVQARIEPLRALVNKLSRLGPKLKGWQGWVSNFPITVMLISCLLPNAMAAVFNYQFNWEVVVQPMIKGTDDVAEKFFQIYTGYVNGVGFLCGLTIFILLSRPISQGLADIASGKMMPHENLLFLRRRCLLLGQYAALIGACLWILAGPVYPLIINAMSILDYVYFIASLTLCGVFIATYPFLIVTWLCTHVYYLVFITPGSVVADDIALLTRVDSWRWRYLALAGVLPMLVLAFGVILGPAIGSRWASILLGIFGVVGVAGFILALWLFQTIQSDIAVLKEAGLASSKK